MDPDREEQLDMLKRYVEKSVPDLVTEVMEEGHIVEIRVGDLPITKRWTRFIGAMVQLLCSSGATVIAFSPAKMKVLQWPKQKD